MAHLDTLEVRKTALEVIFDLLMWYGLQGFLDTECDNIESVLDSTLTDTYTQGLFCLKPFVYTSHLPLVYFLTFTGGNTSFSVQGTNPIVAVISKLLDDRDLDIRTKVSKFFPPLNQIVIKYIINWYICFDHFIIIIF